MEKPIGVESRDVGASACRHDNREGGFCHHPIVKSYFSFFFWWHIKISVFSLSLFKLVHNVASPLIQNHFGNSAGNANQSSLFK
jgi:hypothetical protein